MEQLYNHLRSQGISEDLISMVKEYRQKYGVDEDVQDRIIRPEIFFYGKDILEMSISALLYKENLLLSGAKATGKMFYVKL